MAGTGAPWQLELEMVEQRCGYLFTSGQLSDCTFVVGSEVNQKAFVAHKLVLAMASPVFERMFYRGPSEGKEPIISVPDLEPDAFKALLQYIYTGYINIDSFNMAWDLWYGAKKYILPHLVKGCNSYIRSVVCPRNVCRVYELAQLFGDKTLVDKCLKIICTNTKEVLKDSSFKEAKLNTVIAVFSLDHLNVDSELDLFQALEEYAEAEQLRALVDDGTLSERLSELRLDPLTSGEKVLLPSEESADTSIPTAKKENLKEEECTIRAALQKIRFLSLSAAQFAAGPARSALLTEAESLAVLKNLLSGDSPVPMPTGFSECRECRQPCSDPDDEGPYTKPRLELCSGLGFGGSYATGGAAINKPAQIVQALSSRELERREEAARAARRLLTRDSETASQSIALLVAAGGVPALLAALRCTEPSVEHDAACAVANIACVGDHTLALVEGGAVPALVGLLGRGGAMAQQAARALGNIAGGKHPASDAVVAAGALPALLALMQPSAPAAHLGAFVRTYRIICQSSCLSRVKFDLLSPALPHITDLLGSDDDQVLEEACWVLYHLLDDDVITNLELFKPELTARLAALPGTAAASVQTAALAALGNMLRTPELRDRCLGAGCLDHIIDALRGRNPSHAKYAAWAAAHILGSTTHSIHQALRKRILDPLGLLLAAGDDECKAAAVRALSNLCAAGNPAQLGVLAGAAALQPYCRLLADTSARYEVLRGLTNLLKRNHIELALWLRLREIGAPELLRTLLEDEWHRASAESLLTSHFRDDQFVTYFAPSGFSFGASTFGGR